MIIWQSRSRSSQCQGHFEVMVTLESNCKCFGFYPEAGGGLSTECILFRNLFSTSIVSLVFINIPNSNDILYLFIVFDLKNFFVVNTAATEGCVAIRRYSDDAATFNLYAKNCTDNFLPICVEHSGMWKIFSRSVHLSRIRSHHEILLLQNSVFWKYFFSRLTN